MIPVPAFLAAKLGSKGAKALVLVAVLAAVGGACYFGYRYVTKQQETIARQAKAIGIHEHNEAVYKSVIAGREAVIRELEAQAEAAERSQALARAQIAKSRLQLSTLTRTYAKHDLVKLVKANPGPLTLRMDTATRTFFDDFEKLANQP